MEEFAHSGKTHSVWMDTEHAPQFSGLEENISGFDVCIVGAGIAGLTTAFLLTKEGKRVVVLDDGPVTGGETERTTAHLSNVIDDRFYVLEEIHGIEQAKLAAESHGAAIDQIEKNVKELGIDCDFRRVDGYLFLGENDKEENLKKEFETVQKIGFTGVEMLDQLPFGYSVKAIRFPNQAQFHVLKYLKALCSAIVGGGGQIFSFEHVVSIRDGSPVVVSTAGGKSVSAANLVVTTNSPISDRVKIHTKQVGYRTYVVGIPVQRGSFPPGLYWDTEENYHYVRLQPYNDDTDILIVGGEDHRTGEANDADRRFDNLCSWVRNVIGVETKPLFRWSGQVYETTDGLAFIGKDPGHQDNVYLATGDSGMGMTHGTIAGMLLCDLICARQNPWVELYNPARKPIKAAVEYIAENVNTAMTYASYLKPGEVKNVDEIIPGEGAIIRRGTEQIAVYVDEDSGTVYELSAVCPHLGGIVCWNSCEKSWDCPAHGSRFDAFGRVIDGPANDDLHEPKPQQRRDAA